MNKILVISLLTLSSLAYHQDLYAHNEVDKYEDSAAKRQSDDEQYAKDSWDDFMMAVKKQDSKKVQENRSSDDHQQKGHPVSEKHPGSE